MAKSLSQITFDFSPEPEEIKPEVENQETVSKGEDKYSVPRPPKNTVVAESPENTAVEESNEKITEELIPETATEQEPEPIVKSSTRGRVSLKTKDFDEEKVNIPADDILFQKHYYAIGEVAGMFNVNTSLIRYWETEFDILQPRKNKKGDRYFRPQDIKNLYLIFDLLRRRKFTIEGAKDYLKKNNKVEEQYELIQSLDKIKSFLLELKAQL
jgi:DNA-binding transcriptional MerR regulator